MCDFYPFQSCICTCVKGLKLWTSKIAQGWEPWAPVTLHMHLDSHMGTLHWHLGWVTDKTIMKFQLPPGSCCDTIVGVIASNTDSKSSIDNSFIIFIFFYQNRNKIVLIFFKWASPGLFFFIFVFSIKLTVNVQYKFCRWLDSNRRPLVLKVTALPTEPQPLPGSWLSLSIGTSTLSQISRAAKASHIERIFFGWLRKLSLSVGGISIKNIVW